MMTYTIQNDKIQPFIPKRVTSLAMLTYVAAICCCNILFASHVLPWQWWFFGAIEVLGFFYFANRLSKGWFYIKPMHFAQKLFWTAFFLRVVWVVVSYFLHQKWTGTAFAIDAGDELYYNEVAQYAANMMRNGDWNIYSNIQNYSGGAQFSDMGYPIYLTFVYWIFGNSIVVARLIKAILGAWTVVLMYKLASRNFGEQTGRMAAIMCMLMPNLIYYCSFQLKEVEMVFLCVLFVERADFLLRKGKLAYDVTFEYDEYNHIVSTVKNYYDETGYNLIKTITENFDITGNVIYSCTKEGNNVTDNYYFYDDKLNLVFNTSCYKNGYIKESEKSE